MLTGVSGKKVSLLETERLTLREIAPEDGDCIVLWRSDRNVYRYFQAPHRLSKEEHMAWYENEYVTDDHRFQWVGARKDTGEKIGVFGVKRDRTKGREAEISYLLAGESRGCGFGSEAVKRIMEWCMENGMTSFKAMVHEENLDSIGFIERMGFCKSGQTGCFILYRRQILARGGYWTDRIAGRVSGIDSCQAAA